MPHAGNKPTKEPPLPGVLTKRTMTVKELATYTGLKVQRIYSLTHTRAIPFIKIRRTVIFDYVEIDKWLNDRRHPAVEGSVNS